jgi:subfamily B ATP-binding cassette protein MsbA
MWDYLKQVLELAKPYRFRFGVGLFCGFLSGVLAFTLPVSLKLAVDTIFSDKTAGTSLFVAGDIKGADGTKDLARRLGGKTDALSAFLNDQTDGAAQLLLATSQVSATNKAMLEPALLRTLNRAVLGPPLYEAGRFQTVSLRPQTRQLLAKNPQGEELVRLNRVLLEDAYPGDLQTEKGGAQSRQTFQLLPAGVRKVIDGISNRFRPSEHPSVGWKIFVIALIPGAMLVRGLLAYLNVYLLSWVSIRAANDLRVKLFEHLMNQPMGFFSKHSTGLLTQRIEGAMAVTNTIASAFATIVRDPISIVVLVVALVAMQPLLSLATLVLFPICIVPVLIYGRKLRKSHAGLYAKFISASNVLHESFTGIRVIKSYNLESLVVDQFRRAVQMATGFYMRSVRASELPGPLIEFIGAIGVAMIFCYFAFVSPGQPGGGMWSFFIAVFSLYAPVKSLSRLQSQLSLARAGTEPVYQLLALETTLPEPVQPKPLNARNAPIRFENVSFAYDQKTVLHDINLTIQPGQLVALVGRTGSGKTSMANLLLRFYDPQQGAVLIGDTDIRAVSSRDLRANIAVVTQDTILFNDTIRSNIALGRRGATGPEIEQAAAYAYAHDFITADQKLGYDTVVGEKGVNVSGGQRQRIAIARAILRNAPILILDEATNSLDPEAEQIVQTALEKLMEGRTTICIAHRLSTIQRANLIVVLDHGRIVETGTHAELLRKGGIYTKLHELSFRTVPA